MKKTVFILMVLCLLAGCAQTGEQSEPAKKGVHGYRGLPVEVRSEEGIPVKVEAKDDKALPVKVDIQGDKALPVKLDMSGGRALPVEVRVPQLALVFITIAALAILFIAVVTCFAAIAAARSARIARDDAKAAYRSADVIKASQQQREAELHASNNQ